MINCILCNELINAYCHNCNCNCSISVFGFEIYKINSNYEFNYRFNISNKLGKLFIYVIVNNLFQQNMIDNISSDDAIEYIKATYMLE